QRLSAGLHLDHLVCAVGSCGTLAGVWLGAAWLRAPYRIWGISVSRPRAECEVRVRDLAAATAALLELPPPDLAAPPTIMDDYLGPGYGLLTPEGAEAIRLLARTEGVFLDPVYTGKAMAGLADLARRGAFGREESVLFLHTGGAPALFAHAEELSRR